LSLAALLTLLSGCVGFNYPLSPGSDTPDPQDITGYWLISDDDNQYVAQVQSLGQARYRADVLADGKLLSYEFVLSRTGEELYVSLETKSHREYQSATGQIKAPVDIGDFYFIYKVETSNGRISVFPVSRSIVYEDLQSGRLGRVGSSRCPPPVKPPGGQEKPEPVPHLPGSLLCLLKFESGEAQQSYFEENRGRIFDGPGSDEFSATRIVDEHGKPRPGLE
jgi:hypothetical protein